VKGDTGAKGDKGDIGATGATGLKGDTGGLKGYEVQQNSMTNAEYNKTLDVICTPGRKVLGGGFVSSAAGAVVSRSFPLDTFEGWRILANSTYPGEWTLYGYAICANTQ